MASLKATEMMKPGSFPNDNHILVQAPKRELGSDMDHMGEINTLKEKIISLEKQISSKNRELIAKDQVKHLLNKFE